MYIPMMPSTAQYLADQLQCSLPTQKMVDIIYSEADVQLDPQPIAWSEENVTVPVFMDHTDLIKQQLQQKGYNRPADSIIAGHKKDIIISNKIYSPDRNYERVVIYGWHRSENDPIQPVYNGHSALYADYSHGIRLISNNVYVNGQKDSIQNILKDNNLSQLISSEGVINKPYYPDSDWFVSIEDVYPNHLKSFHLFQNYPNPFNPATVIPFQLPRQSHVAVQIYNALGQKIDVLVDERLKPGIHTVNWKGMNSAGQQAPSGLYFYRIQAGDYSQVNRMVLLR
jgi:hypothetical protein